MEPGKPHSSREEEAHRPFKQQRTSHAPSQGLERGDVQLPEPQAWLPTPMLGGEPLTDDVSIRDFNGGIGCHVVPIPEETLLLPRDMVELRGFKRSEVFLHTNDSWAWYVFIFSQFFFFYLIHHSSFFFFFKRLSKALSDWRRCSTPSLNNWTTRKNGGLLLCRPLLLLKTTMLISRRN